MVSPPASSLLAQALAAQEAERRKRDEAEKKRKADEAEAQAAEDERLRIRMEQMKAEMAAVEDMVTKWLEKNCVDGYHLDMHINFAYPTEYKVSRRRAPRPRGGAVTLAHAATGGGGHISACRGCSRAMR